MHCQTVSKSNISGRNQRIQWNALVVRQRLNYINVDLRGVIPADLRCYLKAQGAYLTNEDVYSNIRMAQSLKF